MSAISSAPPSEAYSILIQATVGCSHNKCSFCGTYKGERFAIKPQEILESDLCFAEKHCRRQDRVFIMDGDALIMPMKRWEWLLAQIRERLPWVKRVGAYANSKAVSLKSDEELARLRELGLGIPLLRPGERPSPGAGDDQQGGHPGKARLAGPAGEKGGHQALGHRAGGHWRTGAEPGARPGPRARCSARWTRTTWAP